MWFHSFPHFLCLTYSSTFRELWLCDTDLLQVCPPKKASSQIMFRWNKVNDFKGWKNMLKMLIFFLPTKFGHAKKAKRKKSSSEIRQTYEYVFSVPDQAICISAWQWKPIQQKQIRDKHPEDWLYRVKKENKAEKGGISCSPDRTDTA